MDLSEERIIYAVCKRNIYLNGNPEEGYVYEKGKSYGFQIHTISPFREGCDLQVVESPQEGGLPHEQYVSVKYFIKNFEYDDALFDFKMML